MPKLKTKTLLKNTFFLFPMSIDMDYCFNRAIRLYWDSILNKVKTIEDGSYLKRVLRNPSLVTILSESLSIRQLGSELLLNAR